MRINLVEKCSDHDLPVIDVITSDLEESFEIGILFQKIVDASLAVWSTKGGVRIPLVKSNDLGLVDMGQSWISVEDKIPDTEVLAINNSGCYMIGYISDKYGRHLCSNNDHEMDDVTHWMKLPKL